MQKKIHLCLLLPHLDLGGGVRRVRVYSQYLDTRVFSLSVCIYSHKVVRDLDAVIGKDTPRLVSTDLTEIRAFFEQQQVTVIYTFYDGQFQPFLFSILEQARKGGIKLIANNVFSYYDLKMDSLFDSVVFQTNMMRDIKFRINLPAGTHFDERRYRILRNPVDTQYFRQFELTPTQRRKIRAVLGFPDDAVVVSRFGRNDIVKWGDSLFLAIFKLFRNPTIYFLLVGVPRSRRLIIKVAARIFPMLKAKVRVLQPTADDQKLMELVQISDIVAHSVKIGEGCSNAINEAMFWKKAVVTNSTPDCDNGQVEQLAFGDAGVVVADPDSFLRAIEELAKSPQQRKKLGHKAFRAVTSSCSEQQVVDQLTRIVLDVIQPSNNKTKRFIDHEPKTSAYTQKYTDYIQNLHASEKPGTVIRRILTFLVKVSNYLEYRFYNG